MCLFIIGEGEGHSPGGEGWGGGMCMCYGRSAFVDRVHDLIIRPMCAVYRVRGEFFRLFTRDKYILSWIFIKLDLG